MSTFPNTAQASLAGRLVPRRLVVLALIVALAAAALTLTVVLAMVMIEWASYGIRKGFRGQALFGFGMSVVLQIAFLNALFSLGFATLIGSAVLLARRPRD